MKFDDHDVLVCGRDEAGVELVPGTKRGYKCAQCGHPVVMAPSGQKLFRRTLGLVVICTECRPVDMPAEPAPGAVEEWAAYLASKKVPASKQKVN